MTDQGNPQGQPDQPGGQYPPQAPAGLPPQQRKGIGGLIATIVVMLLAGGAIGYVVGPKVLDDDDAEEVSSAAPETTTTTTATADPDTWAHPEGFQATMPAGWKVGSDKTGLGRFSLVARPSAPEADAFEAGGLILSFDRRPDRTPEIDLQDAPLPDSCTATPAKPWTHGELTGLIQTATACPGGFDYVRVVVTLPGGSLLIVSSAEKGLDEAAVKAAIDSFEPEANPATQVAPQAGCTSGEPSTDPAYPLSFTMKNHLDEPVTFGYLNPQGQVIDGAEVAAGRATSYYTKQGDAYRATLADGTTKDYTATDAAKQCVLLTDTGFTPVP